MAERIYRLERVIPPIGVAGHARVATEADRDLLIAWVDAFIGEALERRSAEEAAVLVDRSFRTGSRTWYLWEDGEPVSMAAAGGPDPERDPDRPGLHAARAARRRLRQRGDGRTRARPSSTRAAGSSSCSRTSSNPTSNKIYQQIGYEPVIDVDQLTFVPPDDGLPGTT